MMINGVRDRKYLDSDNINLGLIDEKGRAIGSLVNFAFDTIIADADSCYLYPEVGEFVSVQIWATRDGETFGAIQPYNSFPSREAAEKHVSTKVAAMRKRYAKQCCVSVA